MDHPFLRRELNGSLLPPILLMNVLPCSRIHGKIGRAMEWRSWKGDSWDRSLLPKGDLALSPPRTSAFDGFIPFLLAFFPRSLLPDDTFGSLALSPRKRMGFPIQKIRNSDGE